MGPDLIGREMTSRSKIAEGLAKIAALDLGSLPEIAADRIGACVAGTGKFICIGLNYSDHAAETGAAVPPEPVIFMKATSAICGPNDDVLIPRTSEKTDWEVELGVVIGKTAKYVSEADALKHVAGYCVINDVSERGFQMQSTQGDKGKERMRWRGDMLFTHKESRDRCRLALRVRLRKPGQNHPLQKWTSFQTCAKISCAKKLTSGA